MGDGANQKGISMIEDYTYKAYLQNLGFNINLGFHDEYVNHLRELLSNNEKKKMCGVCGTVEEVEQ